jgi:hypothetical protein
MRPTRVLAVTVLAAVLTLTGCSSGDDSDDDGGGGDSRASAAEKPQSGPAPDADRLDSAVEDGTALSQLSESVEDESAPPEQADDRAVIRKGNVQLNSDDVEKALFDVQAVVDKYGGEITDRETGTNDDGDVRMARLLLRIPAKDFSDAFAKLEGVADLASSSSTSEDVTEQIIDVDARIRAQRSSLNRVEVLLDRAQSIRDIVAIESQLTRRQADLDSLVRRQAFLRSQTSMSTITVNIQLSSETKTTKTTAKEKTDNDLGFFSGLEGGTKALVIFAVGLATFVGAVLPWTLLLLVVGWPIWLLVRRRRALTPTAAATPTDA